MNEYDRTEAKTCFITAENDIKSGYKNNEFRLYIQPEYDQVNNIICAASAIPMWVRAGKLVLSADEFSEASKRAGLSAAVDIFAAEKACFLLSKWERGCLPLLPLTISISAESVLDDSFCDKLCKLTNSYKTDRRLIRPAISEKTYTDSPSRTASFVQRLCTEGFEPAIFDFSGCLDALKNMPVNSVFFSPKFTGDDIDTRGGIILSSLIHMVHRLGIRITAQNVSTSKYSEYLKSIDCRFVQGSLFYNVMHVTAYEAILRSERDDISENSSVSVPPYEFSNLWSMDSSDNLIFNSLMGAAGFFEYDGNALSAMRINNRFYSDTGIERSPDGEPLDLLAYIVSDDVPLLVAAIKDSRDIHGEVSLQLRINKGNSQNSTWLKLFLHVVGDTGNCVLVYIYAENITQQRDDMHLHLHQRDNIMKIISQLPSVIIAAEFGDPTKITYYGESLLQLTGFSADEIEEFYMTAPAAAIHSDDIKELHSKIINALINSDSFECRLRIIYKDNTYHWFQLYAQITLESSGTSSLYGTLYNIDDSVKETQKRETYIKTLEKKYSHMQNMYSMFPCGIIRYACEDEGLRILSLNDSAWRILGFTSKAHYIFYSRKMFKLQNIHPDDIDAVRTRLKLSIDNVRGDTFDTRFIRIDKTVGWAHVITQFLVDDNGVKTMLLTFVDITATRKDPLSDGNYERYHVITDNIKLAVAEWHHEDKHFYSSPYFSSYALCSPDCASLLESTDIAPGKYAHPDDTRRLKNVLIPLKGGRKKHTEDSIRMKLCDNGYIWTRIIMHNICDKKGNAIKTIGIFENIDDTVKTKFALERTNLFLNTTLADIPYCVMICEISHGTPSPLFISKNTFELFGISHEEHAFEKYFEEFLRFSDDLSSDILRRLRCGETVNVSKFSLKRRDGSAMWLNVTCRFHGYHTESPICCITLRDISADVFKEQEQKDICSTDIPKKL